MSCNPIELTYTYIYIHTDNPQVGDQLDRGDDELGLLHLLKDLQNQAKNAGGALHIMIGNHEVCVHVHVRMYV
jgi:hypothetical protein